MRKAYGVVTKGNGEAFINDQTHMSLSIGGGQAGQGYPCVLILNPSDAILTKGKEDEAEDTE